MKFKDIISFIISLLLMFTLLIIQISLFVNYRLLNSEFYKNTIEKTNYFTLLNSEIDEAFMNLSVMTAIPKDVFTNAISKDFIKGETLKSIDNVSQYMKYKNDLLGIKTDTKVFEESMNKYLEVYAKEKSIEINNDIKGQIKEVSVSAGDMIDRYVNLFNVEAVARFGEFQKFRSLCYYVGNYNLVYISSSVALILLLVLVLLNRRRTWKAYMWAGSSFVAAGFMTIVPAALALIYKIPYRISITTPHLKEGLTNFMLGYVYFLLLSGIACAAVGVMFLIIYVCISNRKRISSIS